MVSDVEAACETSSIFINHAATTFGAGKFAPVTLEAANDDSRTPDSCLEKLPADTLLVLQSNGTEIVSVRPVPVALTKYVTEEELQAIETHINNLYQLKYFFTSPWFLLFLTIPLLLLGVLWTTGKLQLNFLSVPS
jgi:hypothetical protein